MFGNSVELYIRGALIYGSYFTVAIILLDGKVSGESHASQPLHTFGGSICGHFWGVILSHSRLLYERFVCVPKSGRVVDQELGRFYFGGDPWDLVLESLKNESNLIERHSNKTILDLKIENPLIELFPFECIFDGVIETALRQTQHLSPDTYPSLIECTDCILVTVSYRSDYIRCRNLFNRNISQIEIVIGQHLVLTLTLSKMTGQVLDARIPSLSSRLATVRPGVLRSTTKQVIPL